MLKACLFSNKMDVNSLQKLEFLCGSKEKTKHKHLLILQPLLLFH